jgi:hypothetical protein
MQADEFIAGLAQMGPEDLREVAVSLRNEAATVEGELTWWKATTSVAAALRASGRSRAAARAAHAAVVAVQTAGARSGLDSTEAQTVTVVARAAAEAARALVAEPTSVSGAGPLVAPFEVVLAPLAVA